jgi:hypothetical protein
MAADLGASIRRPQGAWLADATAAAWRLPLPAVLAGTALVALMMSTQFLFQPFVWRTWSLAEIADAWAEIAGAHLVVAAAIAAALVIAGRLNLTRLGHQALALGGALLIGATLGELLLMALGSPDAPIDPEEALTDGLHWTVTAVSIALIYCLWRGDKLAKAATAADAVRHAQLQRLAAATELEALRRQIEPHFLFNTLATVRGLHHSAPQEAGALLKHLLHFMDATLSAQALERTTLRRELDLVLAYLSVCQARMGGRLRTRLQVADNLLDLEFPPLSLATLVENAVIHGLSPAPEGGTISISAGRSGEALQVSVVDDGVGFQGDGGSGIGLANVRARLRALYGAQGRLALEANAPSGVRATLFLPAVWGA